MESKEFNQEEIMDTVNETVSEAVEKSQSQKGEVTTLILMNLNTIYELAREGHTQLEICARLGVNPRTFRKIRDNNKALQAVLEAAEQDMTDRVKQSLFMMTRARMVKQQKVLSSGKIVEHEVFVPADASLIKYYLNNKSAGEFADKQEVAVTRKEFIIDIIESDNMVEDVNFTVVEEEEKDCNPDKK